MISTSQQWNNAFARTVVPETFVEVTLGVIDMNASKNVTVTTFNESGMLSNHRNVLSSKESVSPLHYATLEENRWLLDGSKTIRATSDTSDIGFVGDSPESSGNYWYAQFALSAITAMTVPGITIIWDSEFGEIPSNFILALINSETNANYGINVQGGAVSIQQAGGSDGAGIPAEFEKIEYYDGGVTKIVGEFSGYDTVLVIIAGWNTPNHRPRIDRLLLGYTWTFDKTDLLSYTHEQSGDVLGTELPKNSITFAVDNSNNRWDPNNPNGLGKFITDRQMVTVRYGVDTGKNLYGLGTVEWIPGGTFYLSEWDIPANGLEATFTARDPFEFMMDIMYHDGVSYGSHLEMIESALSMCSFPNEIQSNMVPYQYADDCQVPTDQEDAYGYSGYTVADVIQLCANAMGSVCWFDRDGVFQLKGIPQLKTINTICDIPLDMAYSYPEIVVSKPIKYVEISYYPIWLSEESSDFVRYLMNTPDGKDVTEGETLRLTNKFIQRYSTASGMYTAIKPVLMYRKQVNGDYRANPRLDLFDWVNVSTKYGELKMILTRIKYTYNGCFKAEYTAREMAYTEGSDE